MYMNPLAAPVVTLKPSWSSAAPIMLDTSRKIQEKERSRWNYTSSGEPVLRVQLCSK
jgi:hypothetical protein